MPAISLRTRSVASTMLVRRGIEMHRPLENLQGWRFDAWPKGLMQTLAGHDVGFAAKYLCRPLLHIHEPKQAQFSALMIEEQIDI